MPDTIPSNAGAGNFVSDAASSDLFQPVQAGHVTLANRVVMAPLTRSRAGAGDVPRPLNAEYYTQRATAGLIMLGILFAHARLGGGTSWERPSWAQWRTAAVVGTLLLLGGNGGRRHRAGAKRQGGAKRQSAKPQGAKRRDRHDHRELCGLPLSAQAAPARSRSRKCTSPTGRASSTRARTPGLMK